MGSLLATASQFDAGDYIVGYSDDTGEHKRFHKDVFDALYPPKPTTAGLSEASKALVADASNGHTLTAGAAAAAVALRFGAAASEGLEVKVIDETVVLTNAVETDLTETVPAGAVVLSVQANLETAVTGDGTGDDGLTKVGIGLTADPDKYGKTSALTQNAKIDTIPDWAVLAAEETVTVKACDDNGDAVTEKFTADGEVRVRIVYAACNSLADAS